MHYGAKRGLAIIACHPSVRPLVPFCVVGGSGSHRLEYFENNFTVD